MKVEEQFLTKSKFTKLIEGTVADMKIPYMDAILHVCNKNDIEPEDVRKFISPVIRDKLEAERRKKDQERKKRSNLLGTRSLQDEDLEGFTGFRRNMGTSPSKGKSIRY